MMVLPFLLLLAALVAAFYGGRTLSLGLWAAGLVVTLGLFAMHATDPLALQF
jgi:hypothetical protein